MMVRGIEVHQVLFSSVRIRGRHSCPPGQTNEGRYTGDASSRPPLPRFRHLGYGYPWAFFLPVRRNRCHGHGPDSNLDPDVASQIPSDPGHVGVSIDAARRRRIGGRFPDGAFCGQGADAVAQPRNSRKHNRFFRGVQRVAGQRLGCFTAPVSNAFRDSREGCANTAVTLCVLRRELF